MQNFCSSGVLLILVHNLCSCGFFFKKVLLVGPKYVLIWCLKLENTAFLVQNLCSSGVFVQNGSPTWCKIWFTWFFFKLENGVVSGAKFVLMWCFFFKIVLLAGAKCAFIRCFFNLKIVLFLVQNLCSSGVFSLQNGAPN